MPPNYGMCICVMYMRSYITLYMYRIHTYIHTCMHTCVHAHIHTCIHAYMHTCIHAYMHTCIHAYMHTYTHIYCIILHLHSVRLLEEERRTVGCVFVFGGNSDPHLSLMFVFGRLLHSCSNPLNPKPLNPKTYALNPEP